MTNIITGPAKAPLTVPALPPALKDIRRFAFFFDEALLTSDGVTEATCLRQKSQPHRHFTCFQVEFNGDGTINKAAVTPGMHVKECVDLTSELGKHGVITYNPELDEKVVGGKLAPTQVTLAHEAASGNAPRFFIDARTDNNQIIKTFADFISSPLGYKQARRFGMELASKYNLPFKDRFEKQVIFSEKDGA